ncbi:MAG: hypothetical protein HYX38_05345 [Rhodospirillales bacterium]|nr:hypothetical protein [Rhodospirillales bacterium]
MRTNLKTLLGTAAIVAALAGGPAVYAYAETQNQERSDDMMGHGGMMSQDGMMGMMNMMGQMSQMMETCNNMMQSMNQGGSGKPNEQWRKSAPEADKTPEKKG